MAKVFEEKKEKRKKKQTNHWLHDRHLNIVCPGAVGPKLANRVSVNHLVLFSLDPENVEQHRAEFLAEEAVEKKVGGSVDLHQEAA